MTKFLTPRSPLLAGLAGSLLVSALAFTANADEGGAGRGDISLETMLEKTGERFDRLDMDGDGTLTLNELEAFKPEDRDQNRAEHLAQAFARIDADGDGVISPTDRGYDRLNRRLNLEGDLTLAQIEASIEERRAERMAELPQTRAEALAQTEARFLELDANGDGVLSAEERPERDGKRKGHRNS